MSTHINAADMFSCLRKQPAAAPTMKVYTPNGVVEIDEADAKRLADFRAKKTLFNPIFQSYGDIEIDDLRAIMMLAIVEACQQWLDNGGAAVKTWITGALKQKHMNLVASAKSRKRALNDLDLKSNNEPLVDFSFIENIPSELSANKRFESDEAVEFLRRIALETNTTSASEIFEAVAMGKPLELGVKNGKKVSRQAMNFRKESMFEAVRARMERMGITRETFMR